MNLSLALLIAHGTFITGVNATGYKVSINSTVFENPHICQIPCDQHIEYGVNQNVCDDIAVSIVIVACDNITYTSTY